MGIRKKLAFQALTYGAAMGATALAGRGSNAGWKLVRQEHPPLNPAARKTSWKSALAYAAISGAVGAMAGVAAAWIAQRPGTLALVPPSVDTARFTPGPAPAGPDLLIVGRLVPGEGYKGHEVLFRALGPLGERLGRPATLRVVGDGLARADLQARAAALGVASQVDFAGRLPASQLVAAYRGCGVFAMPSRVERRPRGLWTGEGLGIVYLEAQACGRPVIASTEGGAPDAIRPGETGLLADPRDPDAIATAAAVALGSHGGSRFVRGCRRVGSGACRPRPTPPTLPASSRWRAVPRRAAHRAGRPSRASGSCERCTGRRRS